MYHNGAWFVSGCGVEVLVMGRVGGFGRRLRLAGGVSRSGVETPWERWQILHGLDKQICLEMSSGLLGST